VVVLRSEPSKNGVMAAGTVPDESLSKQRDLDRTGRYWNDRNESDMSGDDAVGSE
jgi:hypothetical protein